MLHVYLKQYDYFVQFFSAAYWSSRNYIYKSNIFHKSVVKQINKITLTPWSKIKAVDKISKFCIEIAKNKLVLHCNEGN